MLGKHKWEPFQYKILTRFTDSVSTGYSTIGEKVLEQQVCLRCGKIQHLRPLGDQVFFLSQKELIERQKKLKNKQDNS